MNTLKPAISIADLIKMKENTGRDQDRLDVKELQILKRQKDESVE